MLGSTSILCVHVPIAGSPSSPRSNGEYFVFPVAPSRYLQLKVYHGGQCCIYLKVYPRTSVFLYWPYKL